MEKHEIVPFPSLDPEPVELPPTTSLLPLADDPLPLELVAVPLDDPEVEELEASVPPGKSKANSPGEDAAGGPEVSAPAAGWDVTPGVFEDACARAGAEVEDVSTVLDVFMLASASTIATHRA